MPKTALLLVIAVVLFYSGLDLLLRRPRQARVRAEFSRRAAVVSGAVIGLLGGFVGLILGSLRMPALLRLVGEPASRAVGTNLAVGVCVGVAGLLGHLPSAAPDWKLIAVGGGASIPAALIGARLTGRLSEPALDPRDRLRPARRRRRRGDSGVRLSLDALEEAADHLEVALRLLEVRHVRALLEQHPLGARDPVRRAARPAPACTRRGGRR